MMKPSLSFPPAILEAVEVLWDYHRLDRLPAPGEGILVFGSNDLRVAEHAVSLFQAGLGRWILFSGARGRMTEHWPETEAATMAALARSRGVSDACLFIEDRATNTGENIRFSRELLAAAGLTPERVIVVQKPYMERRTQAALDVQWPGAVCQVTSPPSDFASYCTDELPPQLVIEAMVGDFQRILDYPALGFASEQPVPQRVMDAYRLLCREGLPGNSAERWLADGTSCFRWRADRDWRIVAPFYVMMKSGTFLAVAALSFALGFQARAAHYKLFVLTGQSNSLGTTNAGEPDPSPGTDPADAHIKFYWHNVKDSAVTIGTSGGVFTTLQSQQGGAYVGSATHWGPEMNFGRTLYRAGVRNFGIIKASRGGGGNTNWSKADGGHMYSHVVNTVNAATAILTANGDTFEIVGLLYLQGESDSTAEANVAKTRIKALTDNLRADLPNASNLHTIIGGIAAAGVDRDIVRAQHAAAGSENATIDYFPNLDLQSQTASDNLHFNKAAKLRIGERFAQAFFAAGTVSRHYGKLTFIGDSITQGGNGDHPSYRYTVFKRLAEKGVPINAAAGYKFTGSVTGPYLNSALTTPNVNGQVFENFHDGHYGWRAFWENSRLPLPAGRYNTNNLGQGTILNWTGQASSFATANAGTLTYTGTSYVPDTVSIMIGINDLGDNNNSANQIVADISTLIDQLRAANPNVRLHVNRLLYTNQTQAMKDGVDAVNAQLQALAATKNAASATSPVWIIDASTGFNPVNMTYDNIHPNATGEGYVGDRIAAALGVIETPSATAAASPEPPHLESGSSSFNSKFEGNEIWNGTGYVNGWAQVNELTETLPEATDLRLVHPSTNGRWLEGTNTGWTAGNSGDWTFEARLKFNANANGFVLWFGVGANKIFVEIYGDRTQDNGANSFNVAHNNLDGNFHTFRIAHESVAAKYHVWRDGVRLTPVAGAAYDQAGADSRLILGDFTSGTFGNNFDVTIDHIRYDQAAAYLPTGADADTDGLPDSWEYAHFQTGSAYASQLTAITAAQTGADDDGDGATNGDEFTANTDPWNPNSRLRISSAAFTSNGAAFEILLPATSPQRNYTLYKSTDLGAADFWAAIQGPIIGTDGDLLLQDSAPGVRGFYKVGVTLP